MSPHGGLPFDAAWLGAAPWGWSLLLAFAVGVAAHGMLVDGRIAARLVAAHPLRNTVLCALGAACCAALYAGITGRSPSEVSLSGQATLAQLAADPHAWSVGGYRVHALPGQPARRSDLSRSVPGRCGGCPALASARARRRTGHGGGHGGRVRRHAPTARQLCGAGRARRRQLGDRPGDVRDDGVAASGAGDPGVQRGARSSASSSVVAAMMSERWVKAWGKLPSCSPLGPISSANRPTWFAYVCIFSKV